MPVVGGREPCPCGSGKRYKACHGRAAAQDRALVTRPFQGLPGETEWVALREIVPAATAPLTVRGAADRPVLLATVLPMALPALVRADGSVLLGLQVPTRSGDVSRDLGGALEQALSAEPGSWVSTVVAGGPRLQDLLVEDEVEVTVEPSFDFWVPGDEPAQDDVAQALERANASMSLNVRLSSVPSAYWCDLRGRPSLRWVLPEDEEPLLDALARLSAEGGLAVGPGTRFLGTFRGHGLLVPVWDLPPGATADDVEEPAAQLRARLDEALATPGEPTPAQRRARAHLLSRQLTLR